MFATLKFLNDQKADGCLPTRCVPGFFCARKRHTTICGVLTPWSGLMALQAF